MISCKDNGTANAPNPRWCVVENATEKGEGAYFEDAATVADAKKKLAYAVNLQKQQQEDQQDDQTEGGRRSHTPFFLGVGLRKPHFDFRFPAPFLKYYPPAEEIALPTHRTPPATMPQVAYHDVSIRKICMVFWLQRGIAPWLSYG